MWVCEKCGSELKRIIGIKYTCNVTMLKNGYPRENTKIYEKRLSKDKEEILTEYLGVKCTNCDIMIANEPDEIGTWKPNIRRTK